MIRNRLGIACLLVSVWLGCSMGFAQEGYEIDKLSKPSEINAFRMKFIQDFDRIGLNTTPSDAQFLRIMIQSMKAKRGVEVGSCNGYGAIHMGMGFEANGGELITLEIDPKFVKQCRENLRQVGLEKTVKCIEGDALKVIPTLEGKFDFVFIDAVKEDYIKYFRLLLPLLQPGAVIVADNTIRSEDAMRDFLDAVMKDPDYDAVTIQTTQEKKDGMTVIYKIR